MKIQKEEFYRHFIDEIIDRIEQEFLKLPDKSEPKEYIDIVEKILDRLHKDSYVISFDLEGICRKVK